MLKLKEVEVHFKHDEKLYTALEKAFSDLFNNDEYLINNEPNEVLFPEEIGKHYVGERAIVFRFAHYLQNELMKIPEYETYNLDCEYNRNGHLTKILPSFPRGTFPDLIIHKRGNNDNNLLIMEFKTYWNSSVTNDKMKIQEFVNKKGNYKYKYGLIVVIEKTLSETKFEVYKK